MPNTRSKGSVQPVLQFPRRKSSRAASSPKIRPQADEPRSPCPLEPSLPARIGPLRRPDAQATLLSPKRPDTPLSPKRPDTPLSLKRPDTPLSPKRPDTPLSLKRPDTPLSPKRPDNHPTLLSPKRPDNHPTLLSPKRPTTPLSPKCPTTPLSPRRPDTPLSPRRPDTPLSPRRPDTPLSPRRPDTPLSPRRLDTPLSPRCPDTPLSPRRLDTPLSRRRPATHPTPLSPRLPTRLPLSPRKRTGDDNGRTPDTNALGSPPKQSRPTLASPRKLGFDENSPVPLSPRRPLSSPACRPSPRRWDEPRSPARQSSDKKPSVVRLLAESSRYQGVKQALHTAVPERLLSRETERASIRSFLEDKVLQRLPASLYISGAPGTGKTASLNHVLHHMKEELESVQTVLVNCMSLRSSHAIFPLLADRLGAAGGHSHGQLQKLLTGPGPSVLLVLDEMDQLDSRDQDVLYTIFEWPYLPGSRLCLIGVANALDLTDRILPRLQARPRCRPLLLHFPPYSRQELAAIVQDRLTQASGDGILDASAVQFCARKVSAVSGDARKALDICRRAVEMVESEERKKSEAYTAETKASRVSVPQVARVLSEVYGDRMASPGGGEGESFPLQQKLLVCCLLLLIRNGKSKEVILGKLHEVYSRLCAQRQVGGVAQGECLSLCGLLESRGIFALKKAKEARLTKVFLKIEERDVENALKDRTLLGSILAAGLP
ncbi:cell division control protein 6 homolog [Diretmus argenteus]